MKIASLERNKFIEIFGPLYENSAFIAEEIYQRGLEKYQDAEEVLISMRNLVDEMEYKAKLQLILEHPKLGIRKHDNHTHSIITVGAPQFGILKHAIF